MMPFTPHLAHECLELFKCKDLDNWPKVDKKNIITEISLAVQVNGKTRDVVKVNKDLDEKSVTNLILESSKAKKYLEGKKVMKTIFVKNKIVNYIV